MEPSNTDRDLAREIATLPPEAQRQVADLMAFLRARYGATRRGRKPKRAPLADEPFIGMWCDRGDMQDSSAWVRQLRAWKAGGRS